MARYRNSFEGGTNGTAITPAGSGGASGDALQHVFANGAGASITYSSARSAHGNVAAHLTPVDAQTCYVQYGTSAAYLNADDLAARGYFYFTAAPAQATGFMFYYNTSSTRVVSAHLDTSGRLYVRGAGATILWTAAAALPLNQWIRIELQAVKGSTGSIKAAYYTADSPTPIDSTSLTGVDCGTAQFGSCGFGKQSSSNYATSFDLDDVAIDTAPAGAFIGPYTTPNIAPVANAGVDQALLEPWSTVTLTGTATDSDGTVTTVGWTQINGTAVVLTGSGSTRTFVAPPTMGGDTLTFRFSATDNSGTTTNDDMTVSVLPATEFHRIGNAWKPIKFELK